MATIYQVIFFSLAGGLLSLVGGALLLLNDKRAASLATYATPFAAGALLAAAFLDLLNEAAAYGDVSSALNATLAGILLFFMLERFLRWFHHHHEDEENMHDTGVRPSMVVIGDLIHNFIDGLTIGAGFLVSVPTGIIVTVAVAAHEIPQEIGDFALLLKKGLSRRNVLLVNALSAIATVVAASVFFTFGSSDAIHLPIVLGLTAGFFIYIAVSDILPSIHETEAKRIAGPHTLLLLLGVLTVGVVTTTLHEYIDVNHGYEQVEEVNHHEYGEEHHTETDGEDHRHEDEHGHASDDEEH